MAKFRSLFSVLGVCAASACFFLLSACGSSAATYSSSMTLSSDGDSTYVGGYMAILTDHEAELVVEGGEYTLTKTLWGAEETDDQYIYDDLWFTSYACVLQFTFSGTCTDNGDGTISLDVPTSGTKLVYYEGGQDMSTSASLVTIFPISASVTEDLYGTADPEELTADDEDMAYFNGQYLRMLSVYGETPLAQTATVSGETLVSVEPVS